MDQPTLNRLLDDLFDRWSEVVGFDPNQRSWTMGEYDVHRQAKELQESRRLDPSGITTFMLMKSFVWEYLQNEKISGYDYVFGLQGEQKEWMEHLSFLYKILDWLYDTKPHYEGNPILDRVDPAVWRLRSPWGDKFDLGITVSLSKRGVNRLRKELKLKKIDWAVCEGKRKHQIEPQPFRKTFYPKNRRYFDDED